MNLNFNTVDKKSLSWIFFILGIISLLILPITILLSKLIYVLENPDIVFLEFGDKWICYLPSISKFATFFPGVLGIILLAISLYFFVKKQKE